MMGISDNYTIESNLTLHQVIDWIATKAGRDYPEKAELIDKVLSFFVYKEN